MDNRIPIEDYIIKELLRDDGNVELVKRILKKLDKETVIDYLVNTISKQPAEKKIPISIFSTGNLGPLEVVVKFLKENLGLANSEIAILLGKSQQATWLSYSHAKKKRPQKLQIKASLYDIPLSEIKAEKPILENIVIFLKDKKGLKFSQIAKLIHRDQRAVWATYNRRGRK